MTRPAARDLGIWASVGLLAAASSAWSADQAPPSQTIVLKAAHLFDSVSGKLVDNGIVVVSGTQIQAVGSDAKIPAGSKVIDLGEATLLPGFIDAHVHLSQESSLNWYRDYYE